MNFNKNVLISGIFSLIAGFLNIIVYSYNPIVFNLIIGLACIFVGIHNIIIYLFKK